MSTIADNQSMLKRLLRTALGTSVALAMLGSALVALSACGGGSPMTVEQRYSAPKTQEEILQDKVDAAKRIERGHGAM
jgi:hypothetical protein